MKIVLLDTGPLGMVTHPQGSQKTLQCEQWLRDLLQNGVEIIIPEICDYELRRELLRANKTSSVQKLDQLSQALTYEAISTDVMRKASEFWANIRQQGKPTAPDLALDADVILAAQAKIVEQKTNNNQITVIIATTNVGHLSRFVNADEWQNIYP